MGVAGAGCGQVYVCLYESEEVVCAMAVITHTHSLIALLAHVPRLASPRYGGRVCVVLMLQVAEK